MKKIKKNSIILTVILLIGVITILIVKNESRKNFVIEDDLETKSRPMAVMIEKEAGTGKYEESNSTDWPSNKDYSFNSKISVCKNGSKLKYNEETNTVNVNTNKTDLCYLYFDKREKNFDFTGSMQEYVIPRAGIYKIELWGAQGSNYDNDHQGGKGGYVSGTIELNKDEKLYIFVGGHPADKSEAAGYNGGGAGHYNSQYGYAGGGATDVRLVKGEWNSTEGLNSRIMVAAGGGGTGRWNSTSSEYYIGVAGAAGGLVGYDGNDESQYEGYNGTGGTQIDGGVNKAVDNKPSIKNKGGFGYGGYDDYQTFGGCAGGSGYYGGGAGNRGHGGGGGGSSYISGHTGCVAITSATDRTPKSGCTTSTTNNTCSIHYSNLKFSETVMIDGLGYSWSNVIGQQTSMPKPNGGTEIGHTGNGYARITLVK